MKYVFIFILAIHALIHLMGFAKELKLAEVNQLTGVTLFPLNGGARQLAGVLWLIACLLLLAAVPGYMMHKKLWWALAIAGGVLSQLLIIVYWKDAKAGTIANIIILLVAIAGYGKYRFDKMAQGEIKVLLSVTPDSQQIVTDSAVSSLPEPVQRWLKASGVVGKPVPGHLKLLQKGALRTSPKQEGMPATAVQYFNTYEPGFVWQADVKMMKVIDVAGRDKYLYGKGNMLIKAFSLVTMVDAKGDKMDRGAMLRYMSEICWFPSAVIRSYMTWEAVDSNSAKATMTYNGISVSGIFSFDEQGRMVSFSAKRYMEGKDEPQDWYIPIMEWKTFEGITVPSKGKVIWKLAEGDFNYYDWEVTDIRYDD